MVEIGQYRGDPRPAGHRCLHPHRRDLGRAGTTRHTGVISWCSVTTTTSGGKVVDLPTFDPDLHGLGGRVVRTSAARGLAPNGDVR